MYGSLSYYWLEPFSDEKFAKLLRQPALLGGPKPASRYEMYGSLIFGDCFMTNEVGLRT